MTPELQTYAAHDEGYMQFCDQYKLASADPATRKKYHLWYLDQMCLEGKLEYATEQGLARGLELGLERAHKQAHKQGLERERLRSINSLLNKNYAIIEVADLLDISIDEINQLIDA